MTTTVVNFHEVMERYNVRAGTWDSPEIVYIGRENQAYHLKASSFANPFPVKRIPAVECKPVKGGKS